MIIVSSLDDLRHARSNLIEPVGFIPTMGCLHEGHISLMQRAKLECSSVIASIYVNPAQFGPQDDLEKYPRNLKRDISMLKEIGVNLLWTPSNETMYPPDYQTWIELEQLSQPLEGTSRPGHFRGVATIVAKLFNCVQPQKAYFGQKDAQQAAIIQKMTVDLNFPIDIVICPTVRETNGLAMSSRNTYLSNAQRSAAIVAFQGLKLARESFIRGERRSKSLIGIVETAIQQQPDVQLLYVACVNPITFFPVDFVSGRALLLVAIQLGETRLIDNIFLEEEFLTHQI